MEQWEIRCVAGGGAEDRVLVTRAGSSLIVTLADGAGGISGGAVAAELAVSEMTRLAKLAAPIDLGRLVALIDEVDSILASDPNAGETTGVIVVVRDNAVIGASVGDSIAWLVEGEGLIDLSEDQVRKPLMGSGRARPVSFEHSNLSGRLLVASDGLAKYATPTTLAAAARIPSMPMAADALVESVILPSGAFHDDVSLALVEVGGFGLVNDIKQLK